MWNLYTSVENTLHGYNVSLLSVLSTLAVLTGIYVIITKNPIISVLFLIGLFIVIAIYLILLGLSFLGLSYLLVYVGAVSILFLFILMLLNVRISELVSETKNTIPLLFITVVSFSFMAEIFAPHYQSIMDGIRDKNLFSILSNILSDNGEVNSAFIKSWGNILVSQDHINSLGNIMYTSHSIWLVLVSLILLLAMVGTIVITVKYKDNTIHETK